jgi:signal transduction histidine kinase
VAEQHASQAIDVYVQRRRPGGKNVDVPFDQLLGVPPHYFAVGLGHGRLGASGNREDFAVSVAVNELHGDFQRYKQVDRFGRHRPGDDVTADDYLVDMRIANILQRRAQCGEVSMDIVKRGDFHRRAGSKTTTRLQKNQAGRINANCDLYTLVQPVSMRLSEFIVSNRESILVEWEAFARTCAPASGSMDISALRDHANAMLTVIAADLDAPQNKAEQAEKSKGHAKSGDGGEKTAAAEHGAARAESGFTVEQMVAEFRAMRASVIRLWTKSHGRLAASDVEDIMRFNEAIDQSLAESISRYTQDLDNSKEMFLAMLGHDLRSPLGAIIMSAEFMLQTKELEEPHLTLATRIASSSTRMQHMIEDLLDFTRSRLGGGIPIERADMSMDKAVHDVADEISAAHPGSIIKIEARDGQRGEWDCARISQALTNLIGNAVEHSPEGTLVSVDVRGDAKETVIAIHNDGATISPEQLNGIFGPMKSRETVKSTRSGLYGNLGLGLYIAERIVTAHRGTIAVDSSKERGTRFTIRLPRQSSS